MRSATLVMLIAWLAVGLAGFKFFFFNGDLAFKKRYFRWYVIVVGIVLLAIFAIDGPARLLIAVPFIGLWMYRQITTTRFCQNCGKTIIVARDRFCGNCGVRLAE